ncbi:MAG: peroxidase family protein [Betaproteobacteria bacterium]
MFSASPNERPGDGERLPDSATIVAELDALGGAMGSGDAVEPNPRQDRVQPGDGSIPAAYTYLGQFIDHDITLTSGSPDVSAEQLAPLTSLAGVSNLRTPFLELDNLYGPTPGQETVVPAAVGARMVVGPLTDIGGLPAGKSMLNDVPRKAPSQTPAIDREARIGDPRNDENLIVQQLHVAFLKAHNTLADQLGTFDAARNALILMYQSVIVDDFLPRICDRATLDAVLHAGNRFLRPDGPLFMPVEFAAAGFRFGHSMVRQNYDFNLNFSPASSSFMFTFTALSGELSPGFGNGTDTFPTNWVIQWERFLELSGSRPQRARPIDTVLTPILASLRDVFGKPMVGSVAPRLATRNLRRGYMLSLPTGQAVAAKVGASAVIIAEASTGLSATAVAPFSANTPLWLYVLAEARLNSGRLGIVGTTIVAETLVAMIRRSKPSIFDDQGRRTSANRHTLADIIKLADLQDG